MNKSLAIILLVFPAIAISQLTDKETSKFLEDLGSGRNPIDQNRNQHIQDSINTRNYPIAQYGRGFLRDSHNKRNSPVHVMGNPFAQNKNQHLKDSLNKRNNPIAGHGEQFLRDSLNNRNNVVRRYGKIDDRNDIVNNPFYATHGPVSMKTLYEW